MLVHGAFDVHDNHEKAFCFIRINGNEPVELNSDLDNLREKDVNKCVPSDQIYRIRLFNRDDNSKKSYLKNFRENYLKLFERLIDKFVQKHPAYAYTVSHQDVLHHFHFMQKSLRDDLLVGSEAAIKDLMDYINNTDFRQPLVLHGPMGSGKTTCLASLASTLFVQLAAKEKTNFNCHAHAIVFRFIGADRKSMDLRNLLKSICLQLKSIYFQTNANNDPVDLPTRLIDLKRFFKTILTKTVHANEPRLIILIDSLQHLSDSDHVYKLDWLPHFLKPTCKLILTVSSGHTTLLNRLQSKYTNKRSYVRLDYLDKEQALATVKKYLQLNKYRLEDSQMAVIRTFAHRSNVLSLHVKLLSEEFLQWKSYTPVHDCILKYTLKETIVHFISKLEKQFGPDILKYVLCNYYSPFVIKIPTTKKQRCTKK